jgi:hypothetical protein
VAGGVIGDLAELDRELALELLLAAEVTRNSMRSIVAAATSFTSGVGTYSCHSFFIM